jgi:hypothetical protein
MYKHKTVIISEHLKYFSRLQFILVTVRAKNRCFLYNDGVGRLKFQQYSEMSSLKYHRLRLVTIDY